MKIGNEMYITIHEVTKIEQKTVEINYPGGKGTFSVTTLLITSEKGDTHEIKLFLKDDESNEK